MLALEIARKRGQARIDSTIAPGAPNSIQPLQPDWKILWLVERQAMILDLDAEKKRFAEPIAPYLNEAAEYSCSAPCECESHSHIPAPDLP